MEVPLVKYYNGTSVVIITIRQTITKEAHPIKGFSSTPQCWPVRKKHVKTNGCTSVLREVVNLSLRGTIASRYNRGHILASGLCKQNRLYIVESHTYQSIAITATATATPTANSTSHRLITKNKGDQAMSRSRESIVSQCEVTSVARAHVDHN